VGRLLLCVAILLTSGALAQPPRQGALDEVGSRMKAAVDRSETPSVVAAVGQHGRIVWTAAFGEADTMRHLPATTATPYSLASVSKPFTATAVMVLSERGQVALDEPVTRYVGGLARLGPIVPSEVTVRRTLGHVAGFPTHYQSFFEDRPIEPLSFARTLECYGPQIAEPGDRYVYSNLGFGVLSELVGRAAGQPYAAFMAREIFEPLGLTQVVWHSGAMPGVAATLWVVPSDGVAVAVLANQFGAPVNQLAGELLAAVLGVKVPAGGGPGQNEAGARQPSVPARDLRGRWVGSLSTCPDATDFVVEIESPSRVTVTLAGVTMPMESPSASPGRLSGGFSAPGPMGPSTFRLNLRPQGDHLAGTVVRTTNLGARGNVTVTLWADLRRPEA
jgi:CubicO group peptidase (beta-lactamase class C family)